MQTTTPPSRYADAWRSALEPLPSRPATEVLGVSAGDSVLVVAAHPDDETFGLGGTLADLVGAGVDVHLLTLTSGEAAFGDEGDAALDLARARRSELAAAADCLGLTGLEVDGLPDGGLEHLSEAIRKRVVDAVHRHDAAVVLTLWEHDPHPDHAAVGRAAAEVGAEAGLPVLGFPIWACHWIDPRDCAPETFHPDRLSRLAVSEDGRTNRAAALACYPSQTEAHGGVAPVVPAELAAWEHELLWKMHG